MSSFDGNASGADVGGQFGHVRPNRWNIIDVLNATLNLGDWATAVGALLKPYLDVVVGSTAATPPLNDLTALPLLNPNIS